MSINALATSQARRSSRGRAAQPKTRHDEASNPARGVMIGLGISAMIWSGIAALVLR